LVIAAAVAFTASSALASPRVLLVGTYHGIKGHYKTVQAAINAAKPYDYILIAPGDYKTPGNGYAPAGQDGEFPAADLVTTPDLTIIGMNRNKVIIDGTKAGPACTDNINDQNWGPTATGGPAGLNGLMVWKADDVTIDNLTACNFLGGSGGDGGTGNEIWWNGGAGSGSIGGWGYSGNYLTTTSSFYDTTNASQEIDEVTAAEYGIFSSNWDGGTWNHTYASNMNDSGYYIGACQQQCNQTIDNGWGEYDALGYSGSNSGGSLVVENSKFDNNQDGFDTNSQLGDNPPPQNGECPNNRVSPITHTRSCWVFEHNDVYDNNNPNVPEAGSAAAGPDGTGMTISGGRYDTIMDNTFKDDNAWGVALVPYPSLGGDTPCDGGVRNYSLVGTPSCTFDEFGDAVLNNKFIDDGSFGHPTNGAIAQVNLLNNDTSTASSAPMNEPADCYSGNTFTNTPSAFASLLETNYPTCDFSKYVPNDLGGNDGDSLNFELEALCDTGFTLSGVPHCPTGAYPRANPALVKNGLHRLPPASKLPTMANPCKGVPTNPWCSGSKKT
jgi:hypothetical protein